MHSLKTQPSFNFDLIPLHTKALINKWWQAFPFSYKKEHDTFGLGFP
jgi:hypothetical protein